MTVCLRICFLDSPMFVEYSIDPPLMCFGRLFKHEGLVQAVSTRIGGRGFDLAWNTGDDPDPVRRRIAVAASALGMDPHGVCCALQEHGSRVGCVDELPDEDPAAPCRVFGACDALITDRPGITLLIRVADCVPILAYDPVRRVVAVVHAGWKGTLAGAAAETVATMRVRYGCSVPDVLAGIGPSIGPCCFEVGREVAERFLRTPEGKGSVHIRAGTAVVDLQEVNRRQLLRCGLLPERIEMSGICTACRSDIFFSYRGEQGKTGRFGLFAGLRA